MVCCVKIICCGYFYTVQRIIIAIFEEIATNNNIYIAKMCTIVCYYIGNLCTRSFAPV